MTLHPYRVPPVAGRQTLAWGVSPRKQGKKERSPEGAKDKIAFRPFRALLICAVLSRRLRTGLAPFAPSGLFQPIHYPMSADHPAYFSTPNARKPPGSFPGTGKRLTTKCSRPFPRGLPHQGFTPYTRLPSDRKPTRGRLSIRERFRTISRLHTPQASPPGPHPLL